MPVYSPESQMCIARRRVSNMYFSTFHGMIDIIDLCGGEEF